MGHVRLPSEQIGHVMVFKAFNDISYAYVLDAESPIHEQDFYRLRSATNAFAYLCLLALDCA